MTTLTDAEIDDIRDSTGADDPSEYSDVKIQARYDEAVTAAPNDGLILPYSYVGILRKLWGIRSIETDRTTDHGDHILRSQIRDATKTLLDYWEKYTGLTGGMSGGLQMGSLSLDIDYTCEDLQEQITDGDFFNG